MSIGACSYVLHISRREMILVCHASSLYLKLNLLECLLFWGDRSRELKPPLVSGSIIYVPPMLASLARFRTSGKSIVIFWSSCSVWSGLHWLLMAGPGLSQPRFACPPFGVAFWTNRGSSVCSPAVLLLWCSLFVTGSGAKATWNSTGNRWLHTAPT